MRCLVVFVIVVINVFNYSNEKEFLKFVSDDKDIILFKKDIIEIDKSNSLLTLSNEAVNKLSNINIKNLQIYILDSNNNNWIKVDVLDARDSKRTSNLRILTSKNKLLFYSDNQIVIGGELWFSIAESLNIKFKCVK